MFVTSVPVRLTPIPLTASKIGRPSGRIRRDAENGYATNNTGVSEHFNHPRGKTAGNEVSPRKRTFTMPARTFAGTNRRTGATGNGREGREHRSRTRPGSGTEVAGRSRKRRDESGGTAKARSTQSTTGFVNGWRTTSRMGRNRSRQGRAFQSGLCVDREIGERDQGVPRSSSTLRA